MPGTLKQRCETDPRRWAGHIPSASSAQCTTGLLLSNIVGRSRHTILIAGSLADSAISNVVRRIPGDSITYESGQENVRNVAITNLVTAPQD